MRSCTSGSAGIRMTRTRFARVGRRRFRTTGGPTRRTLASRRSRTEIATRRNVTLRTLITTFILALVAIPSLADDLRVDLEKLPAGSQIDLTGQWPYKPGYAIASDEHPESDPKQGGYVAVPVPQ